jgi:hypothetical protein
VLDVKRATTADQPLEVRISGGYQPWKPCKTMRRVLVLAWGKDSTQWKGRSITLKRDPSVKWAGEAVGGIRIHAMSHIDRRLEMSLTETRGKKKPFVVEKLEAKPKDTTLVEKYAKRLAELKPDEIEPAFVKFNEAAPSMDDATSAAIYDLFRQYRKDSCA